MLRAKVRHQPKPCAIDGCARPITARGWCVVHYRRWRRHGDPLFRFKAANGELRRFLAEHVVPYTGDKCLIWPYTRDRQGYAKIMVGGACKSVSRLVCEGVNGPPPSPNYDAAHSCGRGHEGCVTGRHLRWATRKENVDDMRRHGTISRGEMRPNAKITADNARAIASAPSTERTADLAARYGISHSQVNLIRTGRSWGWATGQTITGYS